MLHGEGGRGRSADRGLGNSMHDLREQSKAAKLQLAADNDRAQLERSRSHLLRMRAADDTAIAKSDLDKVVNLDKQLADIKQEAVTSRAGFGTASKVILASSEANRKLQEDAARVANQIRALRTKITKLVSQSSADKISAAVDEDKKDVAQENLSSALVRRNRREKRVEEERRRLDRLELKYQAADKHAAAKLAEVESETKEANDDVSKLHAKFAQPLPIHLPKVVSAEQRQKQVHAALAAANREMKSRAVKTALQRVKKIYRKGAFTLHGSSHRKSHPA